MTTDGSGTFKGDSPGKKLSRLRHWLSASSWMRALGIPYDGALVLAGHGGDASTLMGLGIDPASITAVDLARGAAEYTAELYPEVNVIFGDVGRLARIHPAHRPGLSKYNAAHLDFCNGITPDNLMAIADVIKGASTLPCWIGVTVMKGREAKGDKASLLPDWGRKQRREIQRLLKRAQPGDEITLEMFSSGVFDPKMYIEMAERRARRVWRGEKGGRSYPEIRKLYGNASPFLSTGRLSKTGQGMVRSDVIRQCLNAILLGEDISLYCVNVSGYHSGEGRTPGGGSGFVTMGFIAHAGSQAETVRSFTREFGHLLLTFENTDLDVGLRGLKHYAIDLGAAFSSKQIGLMLDVKKEVVAAWKAHGTMGSYDHELAEMAKARLGASFYTSEMEPCKLGWGVVQSMAEGGSDLDACVSAAEEMHARRSSGGPRWEE